MPRYCISAGHGLRDPGAVNVGLDLFEHLHAYQIAWMLRDELERDGASVEFVSCFQSLARKIENVNDRHADAPFDLALEIHFNSAASPKANGTEVLYYSTKNVELASRMSAEISSAISTRDRGAVKRDNLGWLKQTKPPAIIVEVLFISNNGEAEKTMTPMFHRDVARAIARAVKA